MGVLCKVMGQKYDFLLKFNGVKKSIAAILQ